MSATLRELHETRLKLLQMQLARHAGSALHRYRPYAKQREFHALDKRERLLIAGNQLGKTLCAGHEVAMHATGMYPSWWDGWRINRASTIWVASETMEVSRDAAQRILLGRAHERGHGAIPADAILDIAAYPNVRDAASMAKIRHADGGTTTVIFKSYDQGRTKYQGDTVDLVWMDEEPDEDIYMEALTRTNATRGRLMMTFTPLRGMSDVVRRFLAAESDDRGVVTMTIDDAEHYTPEDRRRIIDSYPEHDREARTMGVPTMGHGAVFPIARGRIEYEAFPIPPHWPRLCGIDFGWDHPTAAAWIAYDRDADTVYVYDCYAQSKQTAIIHAAAIRARGDWIPVAWPHDGLQHDKGSGDQLAKQYKSHGVHMLPQRATFADGSNSVEAGLNEMLERMQTGRLRIASHLAPLWDELRTYHRDEDGRLVKVRDDIISAARYAVMMKRHAKVRTSSEMRVPIYPVDY